MPSTYADATLRDFVVHQWALLCKLDGAISRKSLISRTRWCLQKLRTRGSWVRFLPGAPKFKDLRAASALVSPAAGPLPDVLSTVRECPHSPRAKRCASPDDSRP